MNTYLAFSIVWISLIFSTPLAIWAFSEKRGNNSQRKRRLLWTSAVVMALVLLSQFIRIRFTSVYLNIFTFTLAYLAYCFLVASTWRIESKLIRFVSVAVMHIPIAIGYVLGTIGFLGLILIVMQETEPSQKTEQLASNLNCEVRYWGGFGSESGYAVNLHKQWPLLPFIEKKVYSVSINETQNASDGEGVVIAQALLLPTRIKQLK